MTSMPGKLIVVAGILVGILEFSSTAKCGAQERYQPSTPTVSPYLNLYSGSGRGQFSRGLPNYYSLVRPQLQQSQVNQSQLQLQQQQGQSIKQLEAGVSALYRQQQTGQPVITGHSSWFNNPGTHAQFLRTASPYSARMGPTSSRQSGNTR